jgi:hypothetical protein
MVTKAEVICGTRRVELLFVHLLVFATLLLQAVEVAVAHLAEAEAEAE